MFLQFEILTKNLFTNSICQYIHLNRICIYIYVYLKIFEFYLSKLIKFIKEKAYLFLGLYLKI
jgi:hypothetical protein